jgi:GT2 family glycosyltransferase
MTAAAPRVSVIIPTYNRADLVCRAIDSALAQTHPDIEIIVVDDGSTDATPGRLAAYGARIRVLRQPNAGVCAARNNGIALAGGEFIAFLDSDDEWLPWKLRAQIAAFRQHPQLEFVSSDAMVVDRDGQLLFDRCLRRYYRNSYAYLPDRQLFDTVAELAFLARPDDAGPARIPLRIGDFSSKIFLGNFFHLSTVMVRARLLAACGGFDEGMGNAGEDYELFSRLVQAGPVGLLDVAAARCGVGGTDHLSSLRTLTALGNLKTMQRTERRLPGGIELPAAIIRRRRRNSFFWAGAALFDEDRPREARPYLWQAMTRGYLRPRAVIYWGLSFVPLAAIRRLRAAYHRAKRLRAGRAAAALAAILLAAPAQAATLEVGPGRAFDRPSAAAQAAQDGDTIAIDPGEYYDCAVWSRNRLTILGTGPGVLITDATCQGKALFITRGDNITIRNLGFARARVPDRNGAGIRAEGGNLTVESSRFINNETGLLAADRPGATLRVIDCSFTANGVRDAVTPSPALSAGAIAILHVERSRFADSRGGVHILSAAGRTELLGNRIEDGNTGVRDALVLLQDTTTLVMEDNTLRRGPSGARSNAAVRAEGGAGTLALRRNILVNASDRPAALLLDWTDSTASLAGNVLQPGDTERSTEGYWRHQATGLTRTLYGESRHLAAAGLRTVRAWLP